MERMIPDTTDFNSRSKKQLVELVIAKYNDCFRLEEENKNLKEKLEKLQDEYDELYIEKCNASNQWKCCEAENKELKDALLTYMRK